MSVKISDNDRIPIITKAFKVRLYLTTKQLHEILEYCSANRFAYNKRKEERDNFYNENIKDKNLTKEQNKEVYKTLELTTQKEFCEQFAWLKKVPSSLIAYSLRNNDTVYSQYYKSLAGLRKGKKLGHPKWKSRKQNHQSFTVGMLSKDCLDWNNRTIKIPKLGKVKFHHAEDKSEKWIRFFLTATPKVMTVSTEPSGEVWCSITFEKETSIEQTIKPSIAIGLDFSPEHLYVDSNNEVAPNYIAVKQKNKKKEKKLQRQLVRKKKGSVHYKRVRAKYAKFEQFIADCRNDYLHKETLRLVQNYDVIGIEDLNLQGMMKFSHNAKNYLDASWGNFVQKLEWKAQFNDCVIIKADRFYPSSKTCNHCGYIKKDLKLSDRVWTCPNCGETIIRDANAGQNLRDNAIDTLIGSIDKSILPSVRGEVMPVEDMEVYIVNNFIYGVSVETKTHQNISSDVWKPLNL